ncbi:MAG: zinc-binding dehydrogenase [Nitrososphaerota archaeon]|jgi:NADPH:quinone reductase-like Zn-dependent oxidoreductase|nr:zinc-binding dehydrogenase [Nitrososphaerota archaeon]MDG6916678.1 zinc-binding dehydrogenase [Nitrososphaerota archaeon]MDG6917864.1 zinc-binding dehydrogenase [Nitrososphaerota archaeon]MDG6946387.1 zinc-binding dehydrogenase [Nitrososphaerota archaeon]MDG6947847.1 zinc-binding dehydrogenase [Nitrososphaerota archaeon]
MKAAQFETPGGPEVLSYKEVRDPEAGPSEVVLRVSLCGVNRIDVWARSGRYKTSLPHIPGTDISGEVVSSGPGVKGTMPGDRVLVYPVLSDGSCVYCRQGRLNLCLSRGFVGVATDGGYAELVKVPAANLIPMGDLDPETAACLPVNFGTAWNGLVGKAGVSRGDTVLVWGAAGGLGHAAVQVAKHLGATVIAVVGDERKSGFVKSLGADSVVVKSVDLAEKVRALTAGLGVSVVFDHVGGDTWSTSLDCLAKGGRMVSLGLTSGAKSEVDVRRVYQDELKLMGVYGQSREDLRAVMELAVSGRLKPAVYRNLPLSSAREAHEIVESREVQGKVLLSP